MRDFHPFCQSFKFCVWVGLVVRANRFQLMNFRVCSRTRSTTHLQKSCPLCSIESQQRHGKEISVNGMCAHSLVSLCKICWKSKKSWQ